MEENKQKFFITILDILAKDYTQTCNSPSGSKLSIIGDNIMIMGGLSHATIKRLMDTKYLIELSDNDNLCIKNMEVEKNG